MVMVYRMKWKNDGGVLAAEMIRPISMSTAEVMQLIQEIGESLDQRLLVGTMVNPRSGTPDGRLEHIRVLSSELDQGRDIKSWLLTWLLCFYFLISFLVAF